MTRRPHRFAAAGLFCLAWILSAGLAAADFTESEDSPFKDPDDSEDNPLSGPIPVPWDGADFGSTFPGGAKLVRGSLDTGDVDAYAFSFASGQLVLGALFEDSAGERNDTSLGIFTGGAAPPLASDDDGGSGFLSRFAFTTPSTGTHEIGVSGFGDVAFDGTHLEAQGGLVPYWLIVAATSYPPGLAEVEGNDSILAATALPTSGGVLGATLDPLDVDYFSIDLEVGDRVAISVFDLTAGFASAGGEFNDAIVGLFDPAGMMAAGGANDDGGPGRMSNLLFTATTEGSWTLAVSGFGDDSFVGDHEEAGFDYLLVVARERACPNVTALISNIVVSTANSYVTADLVGGDHFYTDRTQAGRHVLVDVPPAYLCSQWIKTANDDKFVSDPSHLSFSLSEDASVFVAFDTRATAEPAWLSAAFTQVGDVVDIRDPDVTQEFHVLRRDLAAGTVVLGGNLATGANSNYAVFARPLPLGDPSQSLTIPANASSVTMTISGVQVQVSAMAGQSASDLAQALADAVNADPTLAAARIYGLASGASLVTTGLIESVDVVRPVPALPIAGLVTLAALLLGAGLRGCASMPTGGSTGPQPWLQKR
jgi:hypothetical protein